jgi:hypothetical protein
MKSIAQGESKVVMAAVVKGRWPGASALADGEALHDATISIRAICDTRVDIRAVPFRCEPQPSFGPLS